MSRMEGALREAFRLALPALLVLLLAVLVLQQRPEGAARAALVEEQVQRGSLETQRLARTCGPLEGLEYDHTCSLDVLFWKYCAAGQESERKYDCAQLSREQLEGYCNPRLSLPGTRESRAACDLRPRGAASPEPAAEPTPSPTPEPTRPPRLRPVGPSYCGDGLCDPGETCGTCARDCACPTGTACDALLGVCRPPA